MNAPQSAKAAPAKILLRYDDLPYGTRFCYEGGTRIFVKLIDSGDGCGTIARWRGYDSSRVMQELFIADDSREKRERLIVQVIDNPLESFKDSYPGFNAS
jgi:hypothetical protein